MIFMHNLKPVLFGIIVIVVFIAAGVGAYFIHKSLPAESIAELSQEATTTPESEESVATSSPIKVITLIDRAPAFVCDKGIPDPSPDIESLATREIVVKAIEARYTLFLHAPIDCIRTYFVSIAENETEANQLKSLSDEELLELARGIAVFFDQPDRERMFKSTTEWDINGRALIITEMTDGSSSGHWNARYVDQMWW